MRHQQLYHPSGRIERTSFRLLLVLALLRQVSGAPFSSNSRLGWAVNSCLNEVPSGNECCSSGLASCYDAGTDDMPDWDVSEIRNMAREFWFKNVFNQDISRWDVSRKYG
mmetsp:Transcript_7315/g.31178  ORF Transcript_7315/g.31178 Transcript_7315/m.31178 type:complete len:110 (-) Transcript_7315:302-631(-)